jgi:hypothetical protein
MLSESKMDYYCLTALQTVQDRCGGWTVLWYVYSSWLTAKVLRVNHKYHHQSLISQRAELNQLIARLVICTLWVRFPGWPTEITRNLSDETLKRGPLYECLNTWIGIVWGSAWLFDVGHPVLLDNVGVAFIERCLPFWSCFSYFSEIGASCYLYLALSSNI